MSNAAGGLKRPFTQSRPTFLARVATDDAAQLNGRSSSENLARPRNISDSDPERRPGSEQTEAPYGSRDKLVNSLESLRHTVFRRAFARAGGPESNTQSSEREPLISGDRPRLDYTTNETPNTQVKDESHVRKTRTSPGTSTGGSKLGTFSGVFVPTSLNVLSILMFLRFSFILGQSGVIGMLGKVPSTFDTVDMLDII